MTSNSGMVTTFDAVSRVLWGAVGQRAKTTTPCNRWLQYVYDAAGNRTSQTLTIGGIPDTTLFTYDDAGQLTQAGLTSYTYDLAGNLTAAGSETYTWDWADQLTSATVNGTTTDFTYDGDGVRVSETTNAVTTDQVWDRASGLPLLVVNGATTYVHGADGLVSEVDNAGVATYHHADALGSVRGLTDGSGTLTGTTEYGAFGDVLSSSGSQSLFGYTGEQTETTTGNTFLRARSYDPSVGRFLSTDTVQPNAPGTQGYNRYAYTANNPTTWTDPSGHSIDDGMAWLGEIQTLVTIFVDYAKAVTPVLTALLGTGFIGNAVGLVVSMNFLAIALLLLSIVTTILMLLVDPFDFYSGANPTEKASGEHPDELTVTPEEECSVGDAPQTNTQMIMQIVFLSGGMSVSTINALLACVGSGLSLSEIGLDDIWYVIQDGLQGGKYVLCIFDCAVSLPGELFPLTSQWIPVIAIAVGVGMCFGMKMIRACYGLALVAAVYASFCMYCARTNNCLKHLDRPIAWPFA